jgi:hypothetical protein
MEFPATLSINRVTCSHEPDYVSIKIVDETSHCRFAEIQMTFQQLGLAITGRSEVDCKVEFSEKAPLGKKRVAKTELVPEPKSHRDAEEDAALVKPFEIDGWKARQGDLHNHHMSRQGPNGERMRQVTFVRYVEPEGAS